MDKVFHLQPFNPKTQKIANILIEKIHQVTPELEVLFMGAAALSIPGKNDIDLDVCCETKKIPEYTKKLIPILGLPKESNDKITVWSYFMDGIEIDAILSDPKFSHVPEQKKVFELLKNNTELLKEYEQLKTECDGLLYEEYEQKKKTFFQKRVLVA